jgi:putative Mg2+ transporter-C (MgtC) family protein
MTGFSTDPGRLGAQVVAGIGFLGAGTIIVTKNRQVKGLTTAAGLWASAIVGLGIGAGYYEASLLGTLIIILAELLLARFEYFIMSKSKVLNLFIEYANAQTLSKISKELSDQNVKVLSLEITKQSKTDGRLPCAIYSVQLVKKSMGQKLIGELSAIDGVSTVEEL